MAMYLKNPIIQGFLMKLFILGLLLTLNAFGTSSQKAEFPTGPEQKLTPGSLCDRPDAYRYPERIPYCNRDVDTSLKNDVFKEYREDGYRLTPIDRQNYKIDHLIPLCAGGSNNEDNLWPQHMSIYNQTDPLEGLGCEKLKDGLIKQAELVNLILSAKKDLSLVPETLRKLNSL
jgi:hypothetical protein